MKRGYFWCRRLPFGNYKSGFLRYNFGNVVIISKGGRNWKAKIREASLNRDLDFIQWKVTIVNWKLWQKMFPNDNKQLLFNDPLQEKI